MINLPKTKNSQRGFIDIISAIVVAILLVGTATTTYLAQHGQDIRKFANEDWGIGESKPADISTDTTSHQPPDERQQAVQENRDAQPPPSGGGGMSQADLDRQAAIDAAKQQQDEYRAQQAAEAAAAAAAKARADAYAAKVAREDNQTYPSQLPTTAPSGKSSGDSTVIPVDMSSCMQWAGGDASKQSGCNNAYGDHSQDVPYIAPTTAPQGKSSAESTGIVPYDMPSCLAAGLSYTDCYNAYGGHSHEIVVAPEPTKAPSTNGYNSCIKDSLASGLNLSTARMECGDMYPVPTRPSSAGVIVVPTQPPDSEATRFRAYITPASQITPVNVAEPTTYVWRTPTNSPYTPVTPVVIADAKPTPPNSGGKMVAAPLITVEPTEVSEGYRFAHLYPTPETLPTLVAMANPTSAPKPTPEMEQASTNWTSGGGVTPIPISDLQPTSAPVQIAFAQLTSAPQPTTTPMAATLNIGPSPKPIIGATTQEGITVSSDTTGIQAAHDVMQTWCNANPRECQQRMEQNDRELLVVGVTAPIIAGAVLTSPVWGPAAIAAVPQLITAAGGTTTVAYLRAMNELSRVPQPVQTAVTAGGLINTAVLCSSGVQSACEAGFVGAQLNTVQTELNYSVQTALNAETNYWRVQYGTTVNTLQSNGVSVQEIPQVKFTGFNTNLKNAGAFYMQPPMRTIVVSPSNTNSAMDLRNQTALLGHEASHDFWSLTTNIDPNSGIPIIPPQTGISALQDWIANEQRAYTIQAAQVYAPDAAKYAQNKLDLVTALNARIDISSGARLKTTADLLGIHEQEYLNTLFGRQVLNNPITDPRYLLDWSATSVTK